MTDRLLTLEQAGERLTMGEKAVQRRIYAGEIAWVNIAQPGAKRPIMRVAESAVADYIARKTHQNAALASPVVPPRSPAGAAG
ncbi:MAG TPA: hypothetical protein VIV56_14145 [Gemmatimonadales bacterium]